MRVLWEQSFPEELAEAARIDGASELRIFAQIGLPLVRNGLITVGLLSFVSGRVWMGPESRGAHIVAVCPPGDHPEGLADVASINPESAHIGRYAIRRLERRPAVSHTGDTAIGCPDLRYGRRAPLDRPVHGLRGLLPPSSVPGPLRPRNGSHTSVPLTAQKRIRHVPR